MKPLRTLIIFFFIFLLVQKSVLAFSNNYIDVPPTHWAFGAIQKLSQAGIIKGFHDNTFKPDKKTTREQFAIILTNFFNFKLNKKACQTFYDIRPEHRSFLYIDAAKSFIPIHYKVGFIFDFNPDQAITREDAAHAIVAALELAKAQQPDKNYLTAKFKDYQSISPTLRESVAAAVYYGILKGDNKGNFRAKAGLRRGELSVIFDNLMQRDSIIKAGFYPARKPLTIQFINFQRPDYQMVHDFPDYNQEQTFYGKITSKVTGFNNSHFVITHQIYDTDDLSLREPKTVYVYVEDKDLARFDDGEWVFVKYDRFNNVISIK